MHKKTGTLGFADFIAGGQPSRRAWLDEVDALVDWSGAEQDLSSLYASGTGRPSYPVLLMFKALLIGAWFNLSDPGLEAALDDTLSFRRFCGLPLGERVPDHSTLCRFRQKLEQAGLSAQVFETVTVQLEGQGVSVKRGTLIDASLVSAQAAIPPASKGLGQPGTVDTEANWTRKGRKSYYGYKAHIAADEDTLIIRRAILTPAKTADVSQLEALVMGDERAVYADKAYDKHALRAAFKARGIKPRMMHRPNKHHPQLPYWKARHNKLISRTRSLVEKLFGTLKRSYGYTQVRFMSLARNQVDLHMRCLAMNLKRARALSA